jgi:hypothetical protein
MVKQLGKKTAVNAKKSSLKKSVNTSSSNKKPRKGSTTKEMIEKMQEKIQNFTSH